MEATKMTVVVIYAQGWKTDAEEIMFWLVMRNIFCLTVCILGAVTFTKLFQTVQGLWKEICCPSFLLDSDSCNTRDHFLSFRFYRRIQNFSPLFSLAFSLILTSIFHFDFLPYSPLNVTVDINFLLQIVFSISHLSSFLPTPSNLLTFLFYTPFYTFLYSFKQDAFHCTHNLNITLYFHDIST